MDKADKPALYEPGNAVLPEEIVKAESIAQCAEVKGLVNNLCKNLCIFAEGGNEVVDYLSVVCRALESRFPRLEREVVNIAEKTLCKRSKCNKSYAVLNVKNLCFERIKSPAKAVNAVHVNNKAERAYGFLGIDAETDVLVKVFIKLGVQIHFFELLVKHIKYVFRVFRISG